MPDFFSNDIRGAIPVIPVGKSDLHDWVEHHTEYLAWLDATGFKGEPGSFVFLPNGDGGAPAGVLASPNEGPQIWSFAGLPSALPEGRYVLDAQLDAARAHDVALGWALGAYAFTRYKSPKCAPATLAPPPNTDRDEVERIARAVFLARDLINTPAEDMGPPELAEVARAVANVGEASFSVIEGDALLSENYPCVHAVGRASARAPRLIDMRWGSEDAPKVTLVGKGVCFDTGGLDIKPREGMLEMKKDMAGAAVMLGLAQALMAANAPIRVRVLIPAVENSVSSNAIRPLDIIRTRAGKTVEVGNTDAEGRLILCDALAEADSEKPDLLIDCATLTGAAKIALGPEVQALYCDDDEIAASLQAISMGCGDPLWRMPIWRDYRKWIDGKCADLNNVAQGPFAGSIVGALYLAEFVSAETKWVHLDIMAANPTAKPGRPEGGEATGLRALYRFLRTRYA